VLKVPQKLYEYPGLIRKNMGLFFNFSNTKEDSDKTEMYKQQIKRGSTKKDFLDIDDYLASLELKIVIHNNIKSIIPRISQMTQKTNQFNLTTKRYSENDIESFVNNPDFELYTFSVNDKFGDSGITGLVILRVNLQEKKSEIDTFLLSCRIIGRNIEYSIMDYIIGEIKDKNVNKIKSKYIKTLKNEQVKDFYENCSFDLQDNNDKEKNYLLELNNYIPKSIKYIKVINGK